MQQLWGKNIPPAWSMLEAPLPYFYRMLKLYFQVTWIWYALISVPSYVGMLFISQYQSWTPYPRYYSPTLWIEPQIMWKVQFLGVFLNKPPLFAQKVHFLRDFLYWPPPKNPYWKIEPRGSIRADTVVVVLFKKTLD